jgi:hypothetical protein
MILSDTAVLITGLDAVTGVREAPAYEAANILKKKNPAETVTIIKPDGTVVRVLEGGRTA